MEQLQIIIHTLKKFFYYIYVQFYIYKNSPISYLASSTVPRLELHFLWFLCTVLNIMHMKDFNMYFSHRKKLTLFQLNNANI